MRKNVAINLVTGRRYLDNYIDRRFLVDDLILILAFFFYVFIILSI